jgi:hypothetical protein
MNRLPKKIKFRRRIYNLFYDFDYLSRERRGYCYYYWNAKEGYLFIVEEGSWQGAHSEAVKLLKEIKYKEII